MADINSSELVDMETETLKVAEETMDPLVTCDQAEPIIEENHSESVLTNAMINEEATLHKAAEAEEAKTRHLMQRAHIEQVQQQMHARRSVKAQQASKKSQKGASRELPRRQSRRSCTTSHCQSPSQALQSPGQADHKFTGKEIENCLTGETNSVVVSKSTQMTKNTYEVGCKLEVLHYGTIYVAKVVEVDESDSAKRYLVHYVGWNSRHDEWIHSDAILGLATDTPGRPGRPSKIQSKSSKVDENTIKASPLNRSKSESQVVPGSTRRGRKRKYENSEAAVPTGADDNNNDVEKLLSSRAASSQSSSSCSSTVGEQTDSQSQLDASSSQKSSCTDSTETSDQPVLLTGGVLRSYQLDGVRWLKMLYENGVNGILADEMGLGKTIQCIALICHLVAHGIEGPFLICAPLSTIPNWIAEMKRFAPKLPYILYHGTKPDRVSLRREIRHRQPVNMHGIISSLPVVVTSYEITMNDRDFLMHESWKLMIVDEGHRIKNFNCRLIRELKLYKSPNRLLLTGTPLQNNMAELWSLLNFLIPEIFDNLGSFETWFDVEFLESVDNAHEQLIHEEQRKNTLSMLHQILTPFMLRRLKTDVDFVIPPKREVIVYAQLSPLQQEMYRCILNKTIAQLVKAPTEPPSPERDANGRPIRKSRRQTVDLKVLLADGDEDSNDRDFASHSSSEDASDDDSDNGDDEAGDKVAVKDAGVELSELVAETQKECDGSLKRSCVSPEAHHKVSDCNASDSEPARKRERLDAPDDVDGNVEKKQSEMSNDDADGHKSTESISPPSGRRRRKLVNRKDNDDDDDAIEKWAAAIIKYHQQTEDIRTRKDDEKSRSPSALVNLQLRNSMALLRRCCNHPYLIEYPMDNGQLRIDEPLVTSCGKLMLLDRMLTELKKNGHRMTQMMDILEDYCHFRQHSYCRLDGSMKMEDRHSEIGRFSSDDVFVFLLSTRAGGLGINLTSADTVVIYDSDWNPQSDLQAQDRCHRIGQNRPVVVYRLITANTVDQKIVERANAKRKLEKLVIHKGKFKSSEGSFKADLLPISPQELLSLLEESESHEAMKGMKNSVISDEDLTKLLDRSDLIAKWCSRLSGINPGGEREESKAVEGVFQVVSEMWDETLMKAVGSSSLGSDKKPADVVLTAAAETS